MACWRTPERQFYAGTGIWQENLVIREFKKQNLALTFTFQFEPGEWARLFTTKLSGAPVEETGSVMDGEEPMHQDPVERSKLTWMTRMHWGHRFYKPDGSAFGRRKLLWKLSTRRRFKAPWQAAAASAGAIPNSLAATKLAPMAKASFPRRWRCQHDISLARLRQSKQWKFARKACAQDRNYDHSRRQ